MRPRLLDLFAGAGGCSVGYARAGWDVTGVDITAHPDYPFTLIVGDALEVDLAGYDAIHASPPCQGYTTMNNRHGSVTPQLIETTRARLLATGLPYVIENVPGGRRVTPVLRPRHPSDRSGANTDRAAGGKWAAAEPRLVGEMSADEVIGFGGKEVAPACVNTGGRGPVLRAGGPSNE